MLVHNFLEAQLFVHSRRWERSCMGMARLSVLQMPCQCLLQAESQMRFPIRFSSQGGNKWWAHGQTLLTWRTPLGYHRLRAGADLERDILYMHWLQPPLYLVSPWLQVGAHLCVMSYLHCGLPRSLSVSIFHKLQSLILSSAGKKKDQNQLDLTLNGVKKP